MCNVNKPSELRRKWLCVRAGDVRQNRGNLRPAGFADCRVTRALRASKARDYDLIDHEIDNFAPRAFFSTLTNVNFDSTRIVGYAREAIAKREALKALCLSIDPQASVDNPMASLQLVSDDLGELQRRRLHAEQR